MGGSLFQTSFALAIFKYFLRAQRLSLSERVNHIIFVL